MDVIVDRRMGPTQAIMRLVIIHLEAAMGGDGNLAAGDVMEALNWFAQQASIHLKSALIHPNLASIHPKWASIHPNVASIHPNLTSIHTNMASFHPNMALFRPNLALIYHPAWPRFTPLGPRLFTPPTHTTRAREQSYFTLCTVLDETALPIDPTPG
eukprot:2252343-Pyramimonas_sp.AAC.1